MILVTIGSTRFPFPRMAALVQRLAKQNPRQTIIFQNTTIPVSNRLKNINTYSFISQSKLMDYMRRARIIVAHGGPATIYQALVSGKIPWVLPREKRFGEHVNDHQVEFCRFMEQTGLVRIITEATPIEKLSSKPRRLKLIRTQNPILIRYLDSLMKA